MSAERGSCFLIEPDAELDYCTKILAAHGSLPVIAATDGRHILAESQALPIACWPCRFFGVTSG